MSKKTELIKHEESMPEKSRDIPTVLPRVDIYENEDEILLQADMPGVDRNDITINFDNGKLALSGIKKMQPTGAAQWEEFGNVEYRRTFSVPQTIAVDKIDAELKNGVLLLHLPKSEAAKPKQIEVKAA